MADWTMPRTATPGDVFTAEWVNTDLRDNTPVFYWKTTSKTVVNTTTETDLLNGEVTLAANVMGSNRRLEFWADGNILNSGAARIVPIWRAKLGATTLFATGNDGASTIPSSAVRVPWVVHIVIQEMNATNAQEASITGFMGSNGGQVDFTTGLGWYGLTTAGGMHLFIGQNNTAVSTTAALAFAYTVELGAANASYDCILKAAKVVVGS